MIKRSNKTESFLLFWIFTLTYIGYYIILMILMNLGMREITRAVTIPLRLVILSMLMLLLFINKRNSFNNIEVKLFLFFTFVYLIRLFIEYTFGSNDYYMSIQEVFFYFISFSVIPFIIIIRHKTTKSNLNAILKSFVLSGGLFSILSFVFYSKFIGEIARLNSERAGEDVLSPLALSYCAALVIGVLFFYLITNKTRKKRKALYVSIIVVSTVPFFLGASRGSLIALILPFVFYLFSGKSLKFFFKSIFMILCLLFSLIYLDIFLQSGLIDRFLITTDNIIEGTTEARNRIWERSFNQFLNKPLYGGPLKIGDSQGYPHNIFLDILQYTGIIGFVPILILFFKTIKICVYIFREKKEFIWVPVIFIQSFAQHMFSGVSYTASWFWISMALILSLYPELKKESFKMNNGT